MNVLFQKISIPQSHVSFSLCSQPPPLWKFQFCFIHILCLKILAFAPHPLGISNDPPRRGYGYFLELHNDNDFISHSIKNGFSVTVTVNVIDVNKKYTIYSINRSK